MRGALRDSVTNRVMVSKEQLSGTNLRVFVGAKDFETSKLFYVDLGFRINWERDDIIEFEICLLYTSPSPRDS